MILALFGTNPYPFDRLSRFLSRLAEEECEEVIVQAGKTPPPLFCNSFAYASHEEILVLIGKADMVVSQGGYGGCLDVLEASKPLILVPRLQGLNESRDDQTELVDYLRAAQLAMRVDSYEQLVEAVRRIKQSDCLRRHTAVDLGVDVAEAIRSFLDGD